MPHGGLALANSTATAIESIFLLILMRKKLNGINGKEIVEAVLKSALACVGMGAVIWIAERLMNPDNHGQKVVISIIMGTMTYGLLLALLRSREIKSIYSLFREKFNGKKL